MDNNIEQLKQIVDECPKGAKTVDRNLKYFDAFGNHVDRFGVWTRSDQHPQHPKSLDDIRTIIAQAERIEALELLLQTLSVAVLENRGKAVTEKTLQFTRDSIKLLGQSK